MCDGQQPFQERRAVAKPPVGAPDSHAGDAEDAPVVPMGLRRVFTQRRFSHRPPLLRASVAQDRGGVTIVAFKHNEAYREDGKPSGEHSRFFRRAVGRKRFFVHSADGRQFGFGGLADDERMRHGRQICLESAMSSRFTCIIRAAKLSAAMMSSCSRSS